VDYHFIKKDKEKRLTPFSPVFLPERITPSVLSLSRDVSAFGPFA